MKRLTEKEQDYYRLKDYQDPSFMKFSPGGSCRSRGKER